jgi:hypothetical protein
MKSFRNFIFRHRGPGPAWIPASAGMTDTDECAQVTP